MSEHDTSSAGGCSCAQTGDVRGGGDTRMGSGMLERSLSRRRFLALLGAGTASALVAPSVASSVAFAASGQECLVVLSLRGGFDALSALPPIGDSDYAALRPEIAISAKDAIQLDATFGLHPALSALKTYWDKGNVSFVHATGQAKVNRSHFAAMDALERADVGSAIRSGWLARMLGCSPGPASAFEAVQVGSTSLPISLYPYDTALALTSINDYKLWGTDSPNQAAWQNALNRLHSKAPDTMLKGTSSMLGTLTAAQALADMKYTPVPAANYPTTPLGKALMGAAELIKADVGARVITIDCGDWDMHVGLGRPDRGWMHDNLLDLGRSLAAFATDLGSALERTTLVTLSEFGRRAAQNDSGGVDHGWGGAMMILGSHLSSSVHGPWPGLGADALVNGDLAVRTDYRQVLAEWMRTRLHVSADQVHSVFPDLSYSPLGVFA